MTKDIRQNGVWVTYYDNGMKYQEMPYKNGKRHGVSTVRDSRGELLYLETWNRGKLHGPAFDYNAGCGRWTEYWHGVPQKYIACPPPPSPQPSKNTEALDANIELLNALCDVCDHLTFSRLGGISARERCISAAKKRLSQLRDQKRGGSQ